MDLTNVTNRIAAQGELVTKIKEEVGKVIVGQEKLIDRLVLALVTDGHILLEGVPGLAKTLSVNTLAKALGMDFKRISFTPDLLPADGDDALAARRLKISMDLKRLGQVKWHAVKEMVREFIKGDNDAWT